MRLALARRDSHFTLSPMAMCVAPFVSEYLTRCSLPWRTTYFHFRAAVAAQIWKRSICARGEASMSNGYYDFQGCTLLKIIRGLIARSFVSRNRVSGA